MNDSQAMNIVIELRAIRDNLKEISIELHKLNRRRKSRNE